MLSSGDIRGRHLNVGVGLILGILLCCVAHWGYGPDSATPSQLVVVGVYLFVSVFGAYVVLGHLRYVRKSRTHRLDVTPQRLVFNTGDDVSALNLEDVAELDRHSRVREGPSLRLQLKNGRYVRLVGYQDQDSLMTLVEQQVERIRAARRQAQD